jgi:hypothetical protein
VASSIASSSMWKFTLLPGVVRVAACRCEPEE